MGMIGEAERERETVQHIWKSNFPVIDQDDEGQWKAERHTREVMRQESGIRAVKFAFPLKVLK